MDKRDLIGLQAMIDLFRVKYIEMDIQAQNSIILADKLGLKDDALSDMIGDGTREYITGEKPRTKRIQALIDSMRG